MKNEKQNKKYTHILECFIFIIFIIISILGGIIEGTIEYEYIIKACNDIQIKEHEYKKCNDEKQFELQMECHFNKNHPLAKLTQIIIATILILFLEIAAYYFIYYFIKRVIRKKECFWRY